MVNGLTLQDVQADSTEAIDVGVVDLGKEANLGWRHGVVVRQEQFELEDAACVRCQRNATWTGAMGVMAYLRREIVRDRGS